MQAGTGIRCRASVQMPWPLDVLALLDEQHLCVWSDQPGVRREFERGLVEHLCAIPEAEVLVLSGSEIRDQRQFSRAVGLGLGIGRSGAELDGTIDGSRGVCAALRSRERVPAAKRRFIVWSDAHVMLNSAPLEFGRAVDALLGTAAENEMVGDDLLLLQRVVFVGRAALDVYSEDARGQFATWFSERGEMPLWSVVTGIKRPKVRSWRAERLIGDAA
jgi:hypothetical protein